MKIVSEAWVVARGAFTETNSKKVKWVAKDNAAKPDKRIEKDLKTNHQMQF